MATVQTSLAAALRERGSTRCYRKGDFIVRAGDRAEAMLVVVDGSVAAHLNTYDGDSTITRVVGVGGYVASYVAVGAHRLHPISVTALEPSMVTALDRADIDALSSDHPHLIRSIAFDLAREASDLAQRLTEAFWATSEDRVRRRVLDLAEGAWREDGRAVEVPVTHQFVAAMAGVSRPTASATLRAASRDGVLSWRRGTMIVDDLSRLRSWAYQIAG